ncbi:MAG: hypothetical protein HQL32_14120 [Planctomycetes bacterium]|nr:hypothetical protein [Planctomycetota bacterium]
MKILRGLKGLLGFAGVALVLSGCSCKHEAPQKMEISKEAFYKDGVFQPEASKAAYFSLMKKFNYPVSATLKTDNFWVCDFLQADHAALGMGGVFWMNESNVYGQAGCKKYKGDFKDEKYGYLGHEIYCLPNQALPEHRHTGGSEGHGPKMEAWHIRYGDACFFSELAPEGGDETLISDMPEDERPWGYGESWFKCKYVVKRKAGEIYKLVDPESYHFLRAGSEGVIITEYATFHNHVEFSKPGLKFANTGIK